MSPRRVACRFGCGDTVYRVTDEVGIEHQIDITPLSTADDPSAPAVRHRIWRYRNKRVGWVPTPYLGDGTRHRPVHIEHDCEHTPAHRRPCTCGDIARHARVHNARTKRTPYETEVARTPRELRGPFRRPWFDHGHQVFRPRRTVGADLG